MAVVLVTGGTGHLGRDLVQRLIALGHQVRVFARRAQPGIDVDWAPGDLSTGDGLPSALAGVHTVIHAATNSPIARRGSIRPADFFTSPSDVDVEGTRRLLASCQDAGVRHFVHVSIVGLESATLPYARAKLAGERLVRESSLSWSVVRAMPFYYLLERMLAAAAWLPVWPMPRTLCNPVDTSDVAAYLAACAFDDGRGLREEIGGPEDLSCIELARQYQQVRGIRRPILPIGISTKTARGMGFAVSEGVRGTLTWSDWLNGRFAASRQAA